ncbi:hypothetical protein EU528_03870 [Candidatus Thorarchaeota archaeon]|nr:MAG: hypothetical protein EU528_03870 [Candidatus Thorarchaeota archaeon]
MDEESKQEVLRILGQELSRQKAIMQKHSGRTINPDNSDEYKLAKKAFDHAYHQVRDLEDRIAWLQTEETYEPSILDKILNIVDKIIKDDDDWKERGAAGGVRG